MGNLTGKIKKAILFVNHTKKSASDTAVVIGDTLEKRGIETKIFQFDKKFEKPPEGNWDIAFSIGGDGTVLYTARCLAPMGVPILPVNLGSFGFIAGEDKENWLEVFEMWEKGEISASKRCILEVSVKRGSETVLKKLCLNDAIVSASEIVKLILLNIGIDSEEGEITLGSCRSDGLIISTPTGSTAYNLSAGGPVLDPEMEAVVLNPICPFALSSRPFVLPLQKTIVITVAQAQRCGVILTVDGQDRVNLECSDKVFIRQAQQSALLIYRDKNIYYTTLGSKIFKQNDSTGG
jgi:NAD+ kinase